MAFKIPEEHVPSVKEQLFERESGFNLVSTEFYPIEPSDNGSTSRIQLEIFVADETAHTYLGPASPEEIASHIYNSQVVVYHKCR